MRSVTNAADKAEKCFALAAHASTPEGEASAALARGMELLERYGLDPDDFDIPGRERAFKRSTKPDPCFVGRCWNCAAVLPSSGDQCMNCGTRQGPPQTEFFAEIFGKCAGCGAVASVGAYCRACQVKAEAKACSHGQHGACIQCDPDLPFR